MYVDGKKWFLTKVQNLGKSGRGIIVIPKFAVRGARFRIHKIEINTEKNGKNIFPEIFIGDPIIGELTAVYSNKRGLIYLRKEKGLEPGDLIIVIEISSPRKKKD